jgi:hypothetical protein
MFLEVWNCGWWYLHLYAIAEPDSSQQGRIQHRGGVGSSPPTAARTMEPLLSPRYKFVHIQA